MRSDADRTLRTVLREHIGKGRCDLHGYMWRRRRALSRVLDKPSPEWTGTAAALAALGLKGVHGQAPTASSVRSMWRRIKREIAVEEAAKAQRQAGRRPANRSPRYAGPPPLATAPSTEAPRAPVLREPSRRVGPPPLGKAMPTGSKAGAEIELPPEAEAKFAALREQLAHADRHFGPPPKRKSG